jgi:ketosteroid isomerase-like protein
VVDVLTGERGGQTKVGVELVLTGTHTAAFELGAAGPTVARTGRHVAIPVFWVMTVNNGKITKVAHYWDMFRVLTRLGAAATGAGSV